MARMAGRGKASWSRRDIYTLAGSTWALLTVFTLWFFNGPPTILARTRTYVTASDGVLSLNCAMRAERSGVMSFSDPPNSTFYDDPNLSYSVEEPMENWDEKRREWLEHHPIFASGGNERILLLTGSQPSPCENPSGDHLLLRLFKNKVDYCRIHGYDIYYGNSFLHPKMTSFWAKLPLIRAAMLAHPEAEWIWWIDSDAVFTDMEFKLPLRRYSDHNLVVHGSPQEIYEKRSWVAVNAGVFLIRNCQWSMDFMRVWARMGPQSPDFEKWGPIQKSALPNKLCPGSDDQSGLIYLLLKERETWADKVYIEGEYYLHGYWLEIVGTLGNITETYERMEKEVRTLRRRHPEVAVEGYAAARETYLRKAGYGKGSWRRPFVTHFTGCQPCSGNHNPIYEGDSCRVGMERALNFADNQVLRSYGFIHPDLRNLSHVSPVPFDFPA
ncbi:Xyloglucan 6-xylosyltransferase [Bertholletia excelsa]